MAALLVTLAQAKTHLRITGATDDTDIQLKLDQAEAIILDYLKRPVPETWDDTTVPGPVTAAILLMTARLFEHRGDLEDEDAMLWLAIERLLVRLRDPAIA